MLDEPFIIARNIVSLAEARAKRQGPSRVRLCCHCGAPLGEGEREEECSGAGFSAASVVMRRRAE